MQSEKFIEALLEQTKQILKEAEKLKTYDLNVLTWKEDEISWNILECLEHLNRYGNFYLPEIEKKIKNTDSRSEIDFKSGLLGSYFAKSMLPKEKLNKMKTFKDKNPLNENLDKTVIDQFINQQYKLLDLLQQSRNVSLNKVKIKISISRLITLKLGDTFEFFINHIVRHFKQIQKIQLAAKNTLTL